MKQEKLPLLEFIVKSYHHFNASALKSATFDYYKHVQKGGHFLHLYADDTA
jgi:hypothetical protein